MATLDGTLVTAAAALAGVLGSAFALEMGTTTDESSTNRALADALSNARADRANRQTKAFAWAWRAFSINPSDTRSASWPKTVGIWTYAVIASAVTITYVLNQNTTPDTIKALAVAFGGYVIAFLTSTYKSDS